MGLRIGDPPSEILANNLKTTDRTPPGMRKCNFREVIAFLQASRQIGAPATQSSDANLGFALYAYQSASVVPPPGEPHRRTLMRVEGAASRGGSGARPKLAIAYAAPISRMLLRHQRIQLIATTEINARALLCDKRCVPGRPVIWRHATIGILMALSPLIGIRLQPPWALRRPRHYFFHLCVSSHPKPLRRRRTLIIVRRLCWNVPHRRSHEILSAALAASETPRIVTPSPWDSSKFAVEDNSPPPKSSVSRLEPRRSVRRNLPALKQSNFARDGRRLYPANQSQKS